MSGDPFNFKRPDYYGEKFNEWQINEKDRRIAELESRLAEAEKERDRLVAENDRLRQDRYDALSVTSKDGLLSSEWIARTGKAERIAKDLSARVRELEGALGPFAEVGRYYNPATPDDNSPSPSIFVGQPPEIRVGHFRRAARVLKEGKG